MQAVFNELEFRLGSRDILRLDRAAGGAIMVLRGCAWVTREGENSDHVLCSGQSMRLDAGGRLFVSAIADANIAVRSKRSRNGASPWRRLARGIKAFYLRSMRGAARRRAWRHLPAI